MTNEELERIIKLINALSVPTYTLRMWHAQPGKKGRDKALQSAAAKIDYVVREYVRTSNGVSTDE